MLSRRLLVDASWHPPVVCIDFSQSVLLDQIRDKGRAMITGVIGTIDTM